jgi:predicted ATP-binding protein involved in virulence
LGTFVGAFDLGKAKHFTVKDARYHRSANSPQSEQVFPVTLSASFSQPAISIERSLTGVKNKTTIKDAIDLTQYGKQLMQSVRALEPVDLPIVAYYGAGRLWNNHKDTADKALLSSSRSLGYEDCLSSASSYIQIQQWLRKATFAALQQQQLPGYEQYKLSGQINAITNAVDSILSAQRWLNFHYSITHEELSMFHQ